MQLINRTYRILSVSLALLVFFSSVGLTIDMHYCKGELKSVAFIGKAKSCHDTQSSSTKKMCPHHQKMMDMGEDITAEQNNCCQNKTMRSQSDDDKTIVISDVIVPNVTLNYVVAFVTTQFSINLSSINQNTYIEDYHPPIISRDIYVLHESFII